MTRPAQSNSEDSTNAVTVPPPVPAAALFAAAFVAGAIAGLALIHAVIDTWPLLTGGLPRWLLGLAALITGGGLGMLAVRRGSFPIAVLAPLLLSGAALLYSTPDPVYDWVAVVGSLGGTAVIAAYQKPTLERRLYLFYPVSLAALALAFYLRTLAPAVGEADTFEMQVNVLRLGISHGSGYPLYLLLARLFSLLPVGGTAAFRINLSAAAFGMTAALVCYGAARALRASRPAAWIGAASLALSIGLWSRAVEAEVYTLHITLVGLILWICLGLPALGLAGRRRSWLLVLVVGLSATNHLTTVLWLPAAGLALLPLMAGTLRQPGSWQSRLRFLAGWGLVCLFLGLLGLSVYLYLPLRWPAVNHGQPMTWELFRHYLTGQEAQGALRLDAWYADPSRYGLVLRKVLDQWGWPGIILAMLGLGHLIRRRPLAAAITTAAWAANAYFALCFYVPDPDYSSFMLPAHLVQAVWMAVGLTAVTMALKQGLRKEIWLPVAISLVYCLAFLLPAGLSSQNLPKVDLSDKWDYYRLGQYILKQPLKPRAAILADSQLIAPLYYLQVADGVRPDLDIVVLSTEDDYRQELDSRLAAGQPVYLGRYLPHLTDVYFLHSVGPLTEVKTAPSDLPQGITTSGAEFGPDIRLAGYTLDGGVAPADGALRLTLYWQARQAPSGNYVVGLRLVDEKGSVVLAASGQTPAGQMYPTAAWPPGDTIADFHSLALDPSLAPGSYSLQVALAPPFSQSALKLENGAEWLTLAPVTITQPEAPVHVSSNARIRFGSDIWLVGYSIPESAPPGSPLTASLYWQSRRDVTAQVCAGNACMATTVRASANVSITRLIVAAPDSAGSLPLTISIPGQPAECAWTPVVSGVCSLPPINVAGPALQPDSVNFNDQIGLDSLNLETPQAAPGGLVTLSARWRGLAQMPDDYTAFVHLLGPDGRVHGQVDTWPVQGARATSSWAVNETLADRFEIRVPVDAPGGKYQVEIGWYLLATLSRLPVLDSHGVAVDDKYVIPGPLIGN